MDLKACCIIQVFITGKKQNFSICFLKYFFHSFMQRIKDFNSSMASLELIKNISHISDQLYMASNTFLLGVCLLMAPITEKAEIIVCVYKTGSNSHTWPMRYFPFYSRVAMTTLTIICNSGSWCEAWKFKTSNTYLLFLSSCHFLWKFLLRLFIILLLCSFYSVMNSK